MLIVPDPPVHQFLPLLIIQLVILALVALFIYARSSESVPDWIDTVADWIMVIGAIGTALAVVWALAGYDLIAAGNMVDALRDAGYTRISLHDGYFSGNMGGIRYTANLTEVLPGQFSIDPTFSGSATAP